MNVLTKLQQSLPAVLKWIDATLEQHRANEVAVSTLGFQRLARHFPQSLLDEARVAVVDKIPIPPLTALGLPELSQFETLDLAGITYKDTFYVNAPNRSEAVHFHELVHVVQWRRLGEEKFLLAYGAGLIQCGYENSPLEQMAGALQYDFERDTLGTNLVEAIQSRTDAIWNGVAPLLSGL